MSHRLRNAYFTYLAALSGVAVAVLIVLWVALARYQSHLGEEDNPAATEAEKVVAVDERALQTAFEEYMSQTGAVWWTDHLMASMEADGVAQLNTPRQIREFFDTLLADGDVHLYKADDWSTTHPVYKAKAGAHGEAEAFVTMTGSGSDWLVSEVKVTAKGRGSGTIEAPEGARILCGRTELGEEYRTSEERSCFPFEEYAGVLQNPVTWQVWSVDGLLGEPDLSIADTGDVVWSEPDNCAVILEKGAVAGDLLERSETFLKNYLKFVTEGQGTRENMIGTLLGMVKKDSAAYELIKDAKESLTYSMVYSNLNVEILQADRVIRWADNAYTAEIGYHAYARYNGVEQDYSGEDQLFRVLFIDQGNGLEICSFQME